MFVTHYLVTLVTLFIILIIITNTMYVKKYFLYQDDGLRAIRALNDLMFNVGAFVSIIPVFLVADNLPSSSIPRRLPRSTQVTSVTPTQVTSTNAKNAKNN